jgi:hypothetical protein
LLLLSSPSEPQVFSPLFSFPLPQHVSCLACCWGCIRAQAMTPLSQYMCNHCILDPKYSSYTHFTCF